MTRFRPPSPTEPARPAAIGPPVIGGGIGGLVGVDAPDEARAKLASFERFLRFHLAAHALVSLVFHVREVGAAALQGVDVGARVVAIAVFTLATAFPSRARREVGAVVALVASAEVVASFPSTSNHGFYAALLATALVVLRSDPAGATAYLRATLLLVCFGAGLQKALHGTWWRGSFLAYELAQGRFVETLGRLLSPDQLASLGRARGFVLPFGPALVAAWAVVIGELALPIAALHRRLRHVAACAMGGLVLGFELVADEVLFGGLFASVLSLFFSARTGRFALAAIALVYAVRALVFVATRGATW